jgi:hypothetical protein
MRQMKFYKTMSVPVLMCGSKAWTFTGKNKRELELAEM